MPAIIPKSGRYKLEPTFLLVIDSLIQKILSQFHDLVFHVFIGDVIILRKIFTLFVNLKIK